MSQMKPISAMETMMLNIERALRLKVEADQEADLARALCAEAPINEVELP